MKTEVSAGLAVTLTTLLMLCSVPACAHQVAAQMRLGGPLALEGMDAEGGLRELGGRGPARLVVVWASWCGRCPRALEEGARVARAQGLYLATVSIDADPRRFEQSVRRLGPAGLTLLDEGARSASLAGVRRAPTFLLLDRFGQLAGVFEGIDPGTIAALQRAAASLAGGQESSER